MHDKPCPLVCQDANLILRAILHKTKQPRGERDSRLLLANEMIEVPVSSRNPVLPLELDEPKNHGWLRGNAMEGPCITLLLQLPSDQGKESQNLSACPFEAAGKGASASPRAICPFVV